MKKLGAIILTLALCFATIFVYGGYFRPAAADSSLLVQAQDFEDIRQALKESGAFDRSRVYYSTDKFGMFAVTEDMAASDGSSAMNGAMNNSSLEMSVDEESYKGGDYSATNVQIEGIDEADIIKTDGEHLYIVAGSAIYIVKLLNNGSDPGEMEVVSKFNLGENISTNSIFIDENRLVVFGEQHTYNEINPDDLIIFNDIATNDILIDSDVQSKVLHPGGFVNSTQTFVKTYDTSDKSQPELVQEFAVDGYFRTARKSGDFIYLVANKYVYNNINLEKADEGDILPHYTDTLAKDTSVRPIEISDVYICPVTENSAFTTIAVLDINGKKPAEIQSYMGSLNEMYMNSESIFLTFSEYNWEEQFSKTNIIALDVRGMNINYRAEGSVDGSLLNQFSMDEYDGYFRIATTAFNNDEGSSVYVLDKNLNLTGQINDIGKGEQIYSVRFMGDRGYVVTFETMDPFFTLDLSDPANPYVAGELKLPGYSNYLHQIDENTILGIGRETQEMYVKNPDGTETVVGFQQGGIKLSLFDISDFANPVEKDSLVVGSENAWADALHNHKAILVDRANGLIGFCLSDNHYSSGWYQPATDGAYIFDVSGDEITIAGIMEGMPYTTHDSSDEWWFINIIERVCYSGDNYYYLNEGVLRAFDRTTFAEVGSLEL